METSDVGSMPAGPEMDELVATRVMGQTVEIVPSVWTDHDWAFSDYPTGINCKGIPNSEYRRDNSSNPPAWAIHRYSRDIKLAMSLLEKFKFWRLNDLTLLDDKKAVYAWVSNDYKKGFEATGDTIEVAICRAALKASRQD